MSIRKWLILGMAVVMVMSITTLTGVTDSLFVDDENSTEDALGFRWGLYTLNDGFENTGSPAWDDYWDENETTTWLQISSKQHTGTYAARITNVETPGNLTSDEIEASTADNITISFWFNPKNLEPGDCLIQTYNGSAYNTWYDITSYPTYNNNTWNLFNEVITDSQYLIAGFRLRFNSSGLGDGTEEINIDDVIITTDTVPPAAPTGLTATAGGEQISLDWNDNGESDLWGYNVYRSITSGSNYTQVNSSTVLTSDYMDTGLYGGGTYYYVVVAVDYGNNESAYSNEDNATATNLAPAAPTSLNATAGGELISLDWNDNIETDLDGYNIYRSLTSGSGYSKIASLVSTSNYTDSPLYGGGTYYYMVTAVDNATAESGYSNEDYATANNSAPAAPTGLAATGGSEEITLDWDDNIETDLDGYNVYRHTSSGGPYTKINTSLVSTSNYTDSPLYGGGTYYYVITAVDNVTAESAYSSENFTTANDVAPAAPTGLAATGGSEEITLDWDDNIETDLDGYNVYRSLTSSSNYTKINGSLVSTSNYTDTGLTPSITYYYVVTALDLGSNESGYSNEDSAIPNDLPPAAPTGLTATGGDEQISLDWNDNTEPDLDSYNVYRGVTSGNYTQIASLVASSNYTDSPLYGGGTYYYVVAAVDTGNNTSSYSNEDFATANNTAPAAPTGLTATAGDEEINLSWNSNNETDLSGYNVYRHTSTGGPYTKINTSLVVTSNYTDSGLYGGGIPYYYVVTAVDNATAESGYSNEDFATANNVAPAAPTGLAVSPGDRQVTLGWDANVETDLDGYNVYRGIISGNYTKINASLLSTTNYTDSTVHGGTTYYYAVTAVDTAALESSYSSENSTTPTSPTSLDDGFEGDPWDENWDENGTTTWISEVTPAHSGTYSAHVDNAYSGYLTTDDLDASLSDNITVRFWFYPKAIEAGDIYVQTYNGTDYINWYDLTAYPTYVNQSWCEFSEILSDSQYFISGFRLRFDATGLIDGNDNVNIDDVLIITDNVPPDAPTNLVATPGDGQISLEWDDNSEGDLDGYNVYRSLTSSSNYTKINGSLVSTSNYTDTGLSNGTTYYYVVTAVDIGNNESGYSNEASTAPVNAPPAAPTGLVATADNAVVTLDWNDNSEPDLDGYNVYRGTTSGNYTKINGSLVSTSNYTDSGLANFITYYYVVTAVDTDSAESGYSNEDSATPTAPTGIDDGFEDDPWDGLWDGNGTTDWVQDLSRAYTGTYSALSDEAINGLLTSDDMDASLSDNITVTFWFFPKGLEAGDILVQTYNGTAYNTWHDLASYPTYNNNNWCQFQEVLSDSQYFVSNFRIRFNTSAMGGGTESFNLDDVLVITDNVPPAAPTNLVATAGDGEVSLDWDDNSEGDLDGYNVYRSLISSSNYTKINGSLVSTSNYTDSGVSNGTTYYYVVTAVDTGANESSYSNEDSATPTDAPPAAPTSLVATAGDAEVSLDWDDNSEGDLDGYNVYRSLTSSSNYTKINGSLVSTSNYTDTGLSNGTTYYYVVTAVDLGANESGYSNEDSATPTDAAPAAPTNLVATAGDAEVSLDWDDNSEGDLDGYNVYRSLTSSSNYTKINGSLVSTSNYTDSSVSNGTTYYYVVTAVDTGANESGYSNEDSATPTDTAPAAPTNLVATAGYSEVTLDWDDNGEGDLDGYNVYRSLISSSNYTKINGSVVSTSNYTDSSVSNGTTYYYVVTAVDTGANESGYSNEDSTTPVDPPISSIDDGFEDDPWDGLWDGNGITDWVQDSSRAYTGTYSALSDEAINGLLTSDDMDASSSNNISVSFWFFPKGLEAGDILVQTYNGTAYNTWHDLTSYPTYNNNNWCQFQEILSDSQYFVSNFRIRFNTSAMGGGTESFNLDDVLIITDSAPPAAPTNLVATAGDGEVSLDWDDNSEGDLDGYNVYRSLTSSSNYTKINGSLVSTSNYTDSGVSNGTTYYYVVTAVDTGANESGYSNEDSALPTDAPPAAPTNLVATAGDGEVSLDWDDNSEGDLDGYNVYRSLISSSNYTKINGSLVSTSNYTDSGVSNGTTYYYVVTAVDTGANESSYSNEDSATPTDAPPAAPTSLVATAGDAEVSLDWDDNSEGDLDGYNVYRSLTSSSNYTKINGSLVSTSNYTDTGLSNGTTYYYVVTAVDLGANESGYSNEDSATPAAVPVTLMDDGFENTPWDIYWDGNGTTDWQTGAGNNGTYSAEHASGDTFLTSDDMDASSAENIKVTFWFKIKDLNKGPLYIQIYNGTSYTNWYNLTAYPGVVKNTWTYFNQTITDSQYFKTNFRVRFDGSGQSTNSWVDDVLIKTNQ